MRAYVQLCLFVSASACIFMCVCVYLRWCMSLPRHYWTTCVVVLTSPLRSDSEKDRNRNKLRTVSWGERRGEGGTVMGAALMSACCWYYVVSVKAWRQQTERPARMANTPAELVVPDFKRK